MADDGIFRSIHDLRRPLTSVRSLSDILHDYPDINGDKRREFLDIIIRETERMHGIIQFAESSVPSTSQAVAQSDNKTIQIRNKGGVT